WGLSYGGVSISLMTWMIRSAPMHIELASALNITMFNLSIGLGAFLGGLIYDAFGSGLNLFFGSVLACIAAILIFINQNKNPLI
ncbi:MFS transporter, partial [Acinetobacter lactucae]|nr:MFS transporter [Acinetobacter lactucae]